MVADVNGSNREDEAAWVRAAATAAAAVAVEVPEAIVDWNSLMLIDNQQNLLWQKKD